MAKLFKERTSKPIHRREFIRMVGIVTGFLILTACIPQPTQPSAIPTVNPPTETLPPTQTVTPTQTSVPPTETATITPTPTETTTITPEPTKLPISACMSDFNNWEKAPAPPGEWGAIDKEKFRSQIANLNHLIADSGIVEAQMKAAGITGKPFDQSVIVKSYLVLHEQSFVSEVYLQQGGGSKPYGLYPEKRNMWPVCIWQMEVNGFKILAISEALASTKSNKGYVVVTGLIAMPEECPDPVKRKQFLNNTIKATAQNGGSITPFYNINFSLLSPSLAGNNNFGWFKPLADATGYDGSFDQYALMWGNNLDLPEAAQDTFFMGRIYDYGHWTKK